MNSTIPSSYENGLAQIERMDAPSTREWLDAELKEKVHLLAGSAEDFPVQAIVNHYPYLSLAAQKRIADAIVALIDDWRSVPTDYPEAAVRALLNLAAELRVSDAKNRLQTMVQSAPTEEVDRLHTAIIRTIATLSTNNDRTFWRKLPQHRPDDSGMAFQVLVRIAPKDALLLLSELPSNEPALGGVARKLPDFVSQFGRHEQPDVLTQISNALLHLPPDSATQLQQALEEEGFQIGDDTFPIRQEHQLVFTEKIIEFTKTIRSRAELPQLYAGAQ
jgi:hypothetical protein